MNIVWNGPKLIKKKAKYKLPKIFQLYINILTMLFSKTGSTCNEGMILKTESNFDDTNFI